MSQYISFNPGYSPHPMPRANVYGDTLMYKKKITAPLDCLISNSTNSADIIKNTQLLQDAFNNGGEVILPSGVFYVNHCLLICIDGTHISGQGQEVTKIKLAARSAHDLIQIADIDNVVKDVSIRDISLDGNASENKRSGDPQNTTLYGGLLISALDCKKCYFERISFSNSVIGAIYMLGKFGFCEENKIADCKFEDINGVAVCLGQTPNFGSDYSFELTKVNRIIDCNFKNVTADSCVVISGNKNIVRGNIISGLSADGILLSNAKYCNVSDNIFESVTNRTIVDEGQNNILSGNSSSGTPPQPPPT